MLDPLVARNEQATASLFSPAVDADPSAVATEIARVLSLRPGEKPDRAVVDSTQSHGEDVLEVTENARRDFVTRMGFSELRAVNPEPSTAPRSV